MFNNQRTAAVVHFLSLPKVNTMSFMFPKTPFAKSLTSAPSGTFHTRAIPYFNILWASVSGPSTTLTINYAHRVSTDIVRPDTLIYDLPQSALSHASEFLSQLLSRAYGASLHRKRVKILINPFGGKGAAKKIYTRHVEPLLAAAHCEIDAELTQYSGHARDIAEHIDTDAYDVIACCSGDGLPHEVFNGLGRKADASVALAKIAVVQLPCGSGNAMSVNLNGTSSPSLATLCVIKGLRTPLDLVSVTQGDRRTLSFLSQSVGIVAESDLGTENLRWMGDARFTYGFLVRLLGKTVYPCDIAVDLVDDSKPSIRARTISRRHDSTPLSTTSKPSPTSPLDGDIPSSPIGLPPLQFGTVLSPLPPTWRLIPYPNLGNFYAGNMSFMAASANFFPYALPSDGCLDLVTIPGDISRMAAVKCLMAVDEKGSLVDREDVRYRKVRGYRVVPRGKWVGKGGAKGNENGEEEEGEWVMEGVISIDGEKIPFEPFQCEVHEGLGVVLSRSGAAYETPELI